MQVDAVLLLIKVNKIQEGDAIEFSFEKQENTKEIDKDKINPIFLTSIHHQYRRPNRKSGNQTVKIGKRSYGIFF